MKSNLDRGTPSRRSLVALAALAALSGAGQAMEIPLSNEDFSLRWDNTLRYNLGMRAESQDPIILNNTAYDESDRKFGRGKLINNRLDILSEADLTYRSLYGLRVSAAGWYDNAYRDHSVSTNPANGTVPTSYFNDTYSSSTKRYYNGPSGEVLDAFAFGHFDLGNTPVNVKIGQHTVFWGEGLLFGFHAISYSQAPQDGRKATSSPGIETKEVFLPIPQISLQSQVTDKVSISAQYVVQWNPNRLPEGGTYFGPADAFFSGPDRLPLGPGFAIPRVDELQPTHKSGDFGLNMKINPDFLPGSTLGVYYRQFHETQPWGTPQVRGNAIPVSPFFVPTNYRLVYNDQRVKLLGLGLQKNVGSINVGAELSYRNGTALNNSGINAVDNQGPRGNTLHAVANILTILPKTALFDTGSLVAEIAYSQLMSVTDHPELFKAVGYAGCPAGQGKRDGCSSKQFVGLAVNFTPQYLQVLPDVDLSIPVTMTYGLHGNGPTLGGGNEGTYTWSIGAQVDVRKRFTVALRYADSYSQYVTNPADTAILRANGGAGTNDRGYVALTVKTTF